MNKVIRHDIEDIWAVCRVRRKATSGVLIDPGAKDELALELVVENGDEVPCVDCARAAPRVVASSSNSPPSVAGMTADSNRAERSKRIFVND